MEQLPTNEQQNFFIQSNNAIAKFCTDTSIQVVNEHNVILTLLHGNLVIERVCIDMTHLQSFHNTITRVLSDVSEKISEVKNELT